MNPFNRNLNPEARLTELKEAPIGRLLWLYSIPAIVGVVVMQLYNIVDRIFIGQGVGSDAIAGLAITFPVSNIATALGILVGAGAGARVSIMLGNGDDRSARHVTGNAMVLLVVNGIIYISLFAIFMDDILALFGATERTIPYARDMMTYILPGLLLTNITFSMNNIMRASGFPVKAMVTMFVGAGCNIILDPIFIYGFGWGIKGAAIATDISMAVSAFFVLSHFFKPRGAIYFARGTFRLSREIVVSIFSIGAAPCIVNVAGCFVNVLINNSLNHYSGNDPGAISSVSVFVTSTSLTIAFIIGICQGMQPIVGYNYGAGCYSRLRRALSLSIKAATAVCVVGFLMGMFIPEKMAAAFLSEPELIASTGHYLRIAMAVFWMVGFQIVATNFFQSIGKAGKSIFLSLTRQVLFLIPLLLILPRFWGLDGIWASFPASDALATVVTAVMIWQQLRKF